MSLLEEILALHAEVDEAVSALLPRHGERIRCRSGCTDCCQDELTVTEVEADRIRAEHPALLSGAAPAPVGACALLGEGGACRIYHSRPYVCRTQGLPLRWIERVLAADGMEVFEYRDICPINDPGEPPVERMMPAHCWTIGPVEERLSMLQSRHPAGAGARIALRSLMQRRLS